MKNTPKYLIVLLIFQCTIQMSLAQVTASTKATLPPGVPTFTCPIRDGFYAIPGACTSDYYTCIDSSPYVLTCPNLAIFDPIKLYCVPANSPSLSCVAFRCPQDGLLPFPSCPGTSIFDPVLKYCVAPEHASCLISSSSTSSSSSTTASTSTTASSTQTIESSTSTSTVSSTTVTTPLTTQSTATSTASTPTTSRLPSFVCPETGNFPYTTPCSNLYFVCSGNNYIVAACPLGQIFNPVTKFCEPPSNVSGCSAAFDFVAYYQGLLWQVGRTGP